MIDKGSPKLKPISELGYVLKVLLLIVSDNQLN